ncbi:MAG: oligoribonuclease [Dehalococcoidia bacterium]|nr:oligoribonuclease [Dehalococcoidia bacterium]
MRSVNNLVWLDLEMTGLDPEKNVIIEVATIITDGDLNVLAEGPVLAVHRSEEELALMDSWNTKTHGRSGLTERVRQSTIDLGEAERQTLAFVRKWVPKGVSPLCGNSISQDRRFLRREMPKFDAYLHYRQIDVSTLKELARRWYPNGPTPPEKREVHQALEDIRESLEELRWYREQLFVPPPPPPTEEARSGTPTVVPDAR